MLPFGAAAAAAAAAATAASSSASSSHSFRQYPKGMMRSKGAKGQTYGAALPSVTKPCARNAM